MVSLALAVGMAGCAAHSPDAVSTGAPSVSSTTLVGADPTVASTQVATTSTVDTASTVPDTTTSTQVPPSGPSPVAGLSATDLRSAVLAPSATTKVRPAGPVAEQVRLPSGTSVWRVRLPGAFPVRSARVTVFVAGRRVGEGMVGPRLQSLVAVTRTGAGLTSGAAVTYRWDGSAEVSAGRLTVIR